MMLTTLRTRSAVAFAIALFATGLPLRAGDVLVTVENLQPSDGFFFTPVWLGFHDGSFDLFDAGSPASAALEEIAETGNAAPLDALFQSATNGDGTARVGSLITAPEGFGDAPVFDPGDLVSQVISVSDAASNRYLSYASMAIPSNDAFFGNGDPMAYPIFNADGSFAGPMTLVVTGSHIYDAGTEQNDGMGAAFSAIGGTATDEGSVVQPHTGLSNFIGTDTAAGTTLASDLTSDTPLARISISIVPEPSTLALSLFAFASVWHPLRRRRR